MIRKKNAEQEEDVMSNQISVRLFFAAERNEEKKREDELKNYPA